MNKIYACIDGLASTSAVIDWAAWSARRLAAPLELLHVLPRPPELPHVGDYTGAMGLGAQEVLLRQLSALDEQRAKIAQDAGHQMLHGAREHASAAGVAQVGTHLRHGELVDAVLDAEADARLFVLGAHFRARGPQKLHLDHHVERVIRAVKRPVLVATAAQFQAPERFVIAYDGSATAREAVRRVAASPLLCGLPALLAMVGEDTPAARQALDDARLLLHGAGFSAETMVLPGEPEQALPDLLRSQGAALLVMGAYGHSRIRHLIVGSTTTTLLRQSEAAVLVLR